MLPTSRIIWTYWAQGEENAPRLVQSCLKSLRNQNPTYEIVVLNQFSVKDYINLDTNLKSQKILTQTKISNLIRLELLHKYGGIWTDATVFFTKSIDTWIESYFTEGFFAFKNPGKDRLLSTWFIASEKDNILINKLRNSIFEIYRSKSFSNQNTRIGKSLVHRLSPVFNKSPHTSLFWNSFIAEDILKIQPYFKFHYVFNSLVIKNKELSEIWKKVKEYPADYPHSLQQLNKSIKVFEIAKSHIDKDTSPLYKFDRRRDYSQGYFKDVLNYLEKKHESINHVQ